MKKSIGKRIVRALMISAVVLLVLAGGIFVYLKTQATVSTFAKPGTLQELTIDEKLEDFDHMYEILKGNHPYFKLEERKTGYNWLSRKDEFEKWIRATKNNEEYYYTIERILYLIQNGHTNVISPDMYDGYRRLYSNITSTAWNSVISDRGVEEKYNAWKEIINYKRTLIPLEFRYIEGSYVVMNPSFSGEDVLNKHKIPQYSVLKRVNKINIDDYLKSIMDRKFLTYDNRRSKLKANRLTIPCEEGKSMELTFLTPDGESIERSIEAIEYIPQKGNGKEPEKLFDTAIIEEGKTAYIKVNSFNSFYVDKDREGIHKFYEYVKDYQNLIIDIRGNGGGSENYYIKNLVPPLISKKLKTNFFMVFRNGGYIEPFLKSRGMFGKSIDKLPEGLNYPNNLDQDFSMFVSSGREASPKDTVGFKGKIYLLVDDYVYSSAESFAVFAKSTGFATIVGTRTGGDGIGIDPAVCALPNSGLLVRFPLEMGLNPDGTPNEETHTEPDIYVEQTYEDFIKYSEYKGGLINPYDTVINKVIEMTK